MVWPVWLQEGPTVKPPNHVSAASVAGGGRGWGGAVSLQERARARAASTDASPVAGAEGLPCCSSQLRLALLCSSLVVDDVDRLLDHRYHCVLSSRILTQRENYSRNPGFVDALEKKKKRENPAGHFQMVISMEMFSIFTRKYLVRGPRAVVFVSCGPQKESKILFLKSSRSQNRRRAIAGAARQSRVGPRGDVDRNAIEVSGA